MSSDNNDDEKSLRDMVRVAPGVWDFGPIKPFKDLGQENPNVQLHRSLLTILGIDGPKPKPKPSGSLVIQRKRSPYRLTSLERGGSFIVAGRTNLMMNINTYPFYLINYADVFDNDEELEKQEKLYGWIGVGIGSKIDAQYQEYYFRPTISIDAINTKMIFPFAYYGLLRSHAQRNFTTFLIPLLDLLNRSVYQVIEDDKIKATGVIYKQRGKIKRQVLIDLL